MDVAIAGASTDQSKSLGDTKSVKPECAGYCTLFPASRYYDPYIAPVGLSPEWPAGEVTIEAHERTGYVFSKWVGTGEATCAPTFPYAPTTGRLDDTEHPITCDTITLTMDQARQVKAVFASLPVQLSEPNLDPVNDNHYVFDTNTPGVCTVSPVVNVACGKYQWTLDPIEGSTKSVSPDPPNVYNPVFTYTTLPSANSEFGNKTLTVSRADGSEWTARVVQIFYTGTADNHPEVANPINTMVAQDGSGCIPNWFYYWRQTSACLGEPLICNQSHAFWNTSVSPPRWEAHIGRNANLYYHPCPDLAADPNLTFGDNGPHQWAASGIDTFAWECRHEGRHVEAYNIWWPGGDNYRAGNSDYQFDEIPDAYEIKYGYDKLKGDSNGDHMGDGEDYVIRTQQLWTHFSAQSEDWSDDGQQSGIL